MESSPIVPFSQISFFLPKPSRTRGFASPTRPWKQRTNRTTRLRCQKMFVPGFGEASPEAKAATNLHNFFTFVAVKIVMAQLESYNPEAYEELMEFLGRTSLNDGNKFCANLMRESPRHKNLALRILEVRSAYCKNDFEWENMKRLAFKMVNDSNTKLMRDYVLETSHEES
ncbi:chaperonin-like RBCX protein 1, chloroplastic [Macadamia integrifolia]|uniref:chaperonin-like RBCX protein 1, chloroplastic n=1 Tax=Macadamia integrifolia TaxID=60698 RepID=UPI001C52C96A|nr:chaperonin-like RBCX protein 1, chloroplastic [Macadamia integrifolia]